MTIIKNEIIRLHSGEVGEANAKVNGHVVNFSRVSVGNANNILPTLDLNRTALDNHVTDGDIVSHVVDSNNASQRVLQLRIAPSANYDARELLIYATANGIEFAHSYIRLGSPYPIRKSEDGGAQILIDATIRVSSETNFNIIVEPGTDYISRPEFDAHKHDNLYAKLTDITNNLTSTAINKPLSANQGRILKGLLNTLGISNIAGLQSALNEKQNALGYTPVQQGTGAGQLQNTIKIGWGVGGKLLLGVDDTDFGNQWPIISSNATKFNGQLASYYAKATDAQAALTSAQAAQSTANSKATKEEAKTAVSDEGITQLNINNKHFITENDGGGNFNRRVGHKYDNGDIPTEFGGHTAYHEVFSNDTPDGSYLFKIANNITDNSAITNWKTAYEISYSQFKIWGDALVVNSGGAVHIKGVEYKPAVKHYHSIGNMTVDFNQAVKHVVTRYGTANATITLAGTIKAGDELVVINVRDDSGTATITGKTMFTGVGGESAATHTLTGQAKVTMFGFDSTGRLMIGEVV